MSSTQQKLIDVIRAAGFKGQAAETMYAIEMAESGGNAYAYNPNAGTGDNSYGLSQVNMIGTLGPARRQQFGLTSNDQLFDPLTNEKAAFALSGGGSNFAPWSTYNRGDYLQYMNKGDRAVISYTPELGSPHTDPTFSGAMPNPGNVNGGATIAAAVDTSSSSGGSSPSGWSELLPWNWGKDLSGAYQSITRTIIAALLKLTFLGGGIALILFGAWRASGPAREQASQDIEKAAPLAAAAA